MTTKFENQFTEVGIESHPNQFHKHLKLTSRGKWNTKKVSVPTLSSKENDPRKGSLLLISFVALTIYQPQPTKLFISVPYNQIITIVSIHSIVTHCSAISSHGVIGQLGDPIVNRPEECRRLPYICMEVIRTGQRCQTLASKVSCTTLR